MLCNAELVNLFKKNISMYFLVIEGPIVAMNFMHFDQHKFWSFSFGQKMANIHVWCVHIHVWCLHIHVWCVCIHMWCVHMHVWCVHIHVWCVHIHVWCVHIHVMCGVCYFLTNVSKHLSRTMGVFYSKLCRTLIRSSWVLLSYQIDIILSYELKI